MTFEALPERSSSLLETSLDPPRSPWSVRGSPKRDQFDAQQPSRMLRECVVDLCAHDATCERHGKRVSDDFRAVTGRPDCHFDSVFTIRNADSQFRVATLAEPHNGAKMRRFEVPGHSKKAPERARASTFSQLGTPNPPLDSQLARQAHRRMQQVGWQQGF